MLGITKINSKKRLVWELVDYFKDEILLNNGAVDWTTEWATYQSTSNNTLVKAQLELLVKSMMQSPEYQLF